MSERLALITGATSGIGMKTSELFAKKGIDLLIAGRNQEKLEQLKNRLSKQVKIETFQVDLSHPHERQQLISLLHDRTPEIFINNAGFGLYGEALTFTTEEQLNLLEVNGKAVLELTLEAARALISKEKKGIILNVSSAAGFQVFPKMGVYAAAKAFVNNFSQALDYEVKQYNVRVLTICPGTVETSFQKRAGSILEKHRWALSADFVAEQIWNQVQSLTPIKIIDWRYRFLTFLSALMPQQWRLAINDKLISPRIPPRTLVKIQHE